MDTTTLTTSSQGQAAAGRKRALDLVSQAETLLYEAAQAACPLQGWCDQWEKIGNHAAATKGLWKDLAYGPHPTGHDGF